MLTLHPLRTTLGVALACAGACLLLASVGVAQRVNAPPGNGGVQEYVEIVPDGRGGKTGNDLRHSRNTALENPGSALGDGTRDRLSAAGAEGKAAAALAEAGAPKGQRGGDGESDGSSTLSAAARRLGVAGGPGGMGLLLPLLMMLMLGLAVGYGLWRRRTGS